MVNISVSKYGASNYVHTNRVRWDMINGYSLGRRYLAKGERVFVGSNAGVVLDSRKCGCSIYGGKRGNEMYESGVLKKEKVDCFVMLLGSDGSHGLDLSFVTHIFLLDKIWDKSLEQQVIARAYRMGNSKAVEIETLVMKDTVEDMMIDLEKNSHHADFTDQTLTEDDYKQTFQIEEMRKLHHLLRRIRLVRNTNTNKRRKNLTFSISR